MSSAAYLIQLYSAHTTVGHVSYSRGDALLDPRDSVCGLALLRRCGEREVQRESLDCPLNLWAGSAESSRRLECTRELEREGPHGCHSALGRLLLAQSSSWPAWQAPRSRGSRRAVTDFGVPPLGAALGILLRSRAGCGSRLIRHPVRGGVRRGAGAPAPLRVGIARTSGRKPECRCFGKLRWNAAGRPRAQRGIGVWRLRVWEGYAARTSAVAWLAGFRRQVVGLVLGYPQSRCIGLQSVLLEPAKTVWAAPGARRRAGAGARCWRCCASRRRRSQLSAGLQYGDTAPEFELRLHGETRTLEALRAAEKLVMLLFTDRTAVSARRCCGDTLVAERHAEELTISLVSWGTVEENCARVQSTELGGIFWKTGRSTEATGSSPR